LNENQTTGCVDIEQHQSCSYPLPSLPGLAVVEGVCPAALPADEPAPLDALVVVFSADTSVTAINGPLFQSINQSINQSVIQSLHSQSITRSSLLLKGNLASASSSL